jgi:hypothetical protein
MTSMRVMSGVRVHTMQRMIFGLRMSLPVRLTMFGMVRPHMLIVIFHHYLCLTEGFPKVV